MWFVAFISEGTIEFTSYDRALSSSQISGQNSFQAQTFSSSSPNSQLMQSNEELWHHPLSWRSSKGRRNSSFSSSLSSSSPSSVTVMESNRRHHGRCDELLTLFYSGRLLFHCPFWNPEQNWINVLNIIVICQILDVVRLS